VEESLESLKLFDGGVADKHAGKYSGGMKRRLSVAISFFFLFEEIPLSGKRILWA
jgi:ABC-type multidrug transport system ATPase subunit